MLPGYLTKQEHIAVAGAQRLHIRSLLDRNQYFDPAGDAESLGISSATWPLFGMLWPSGSRLAEHMALRPVNAAEHILEIGCGLALASLVAHRRGAHVTASDCHPLAAGFLLCNLRINGLAPMPYVHGQWGGDAQLAPDDTTQAALRQRYDLIMGSDVLYERDAKGDLARFIASHASPVVEVCIIDPDRSNRSAFSQRMLALGFTLQEERLDIAATESSEAYKGRMMTYRRSG
jgi:predicted nicotinamide N-methyase